MTWTTIAIGLGASAALFLLFAWLLERFVDQVVRALGGSGADRKG